jgi:hypothetical protein
VAHIFTTWSDDFIDEKIWISPLCNLILATMVGHEHGWKVEHPPYG